MSLWTNSGILTSGFVTEKILNLEVTTLCMSRKRWVSGWCFIIYLAFWKHTCFFGYLLIMDVIWNVNVFLRIFDWYPYLAVMWVDEMSCRKGVWKFDTLWEHPLGKGEATCHSSWSWLYSLCTEDTWKATTRVHDAMILQEVMEDW